MMYDYEGEGVEGNVINSLEVPLCSGDEEKVALEGIVDRFVSDKLIKPPFDYECQIEWSNRGVEKGFKESASVGKFMNINENWAYADQSYVLFPSESKLQLNVK